MASKRGRMIPESKLDVSGELFGFTLDDPEPKSVTMWMGDDGMAYEVAVFHRVWLEDLDLTTHQALRAVAEIKEEKKRKS
jgi:hypothetical protein